MTHSRNSKSTEYKKRLIKTWNEIAPRYHARWAKNNVGPFKSSAELVRAARIAPDSSILDLACGTGAVTQAVLAKLGTCGHVIGVDSSYTAIRIARKSNRSANLDLVVADAENLTFNEKFDIVTCQYALFFFPNVQMTLKNVRRCMKKNATLALAVHGKGNAVPFFSSIIDVVTKFIPDYLPPGAPSLDRFGTKRELENEISKAGFSNIRIKQYQFEYSPGTFASYWSNYIRYVATPLKQKIRNLEKSRLKQMKAQVMQKTLPYTKKDDTIVFPWKVLILTANKS